MSGLSALARLEPAASKFESRVDGGRIPDVDISLLAGALGRMTSDQSALVRVIVLNDPKSYRHVLARVRGMLLSSLLSLDEQVVLGKIIMQSVIMPSLCKTCDGHSQHMHEARLIVCPDCGGTGKRHLHGSEHGANAGIRNWAWYDEEYNRCRRVLFGWMKEAGRVMSEEMD